MGEFDLIARYFNRDVRQGLGDDCAVWTPTPQTQLCISSDMLVEGRHFFPDIDPEALGHKALAVNLSDLAACGAKPRAWTLALALPQVNPAWLERFSNGLFALAEAFDCRLIGGDTTQGPLNICITVFGEVPTGGALLRSGAQVGDDVYVSGTVGHARLALEMLRGNVPATPDQLQTMRPFLERPSPRVALGLALRGVATASIDVSDGLAGDLKHILKASKVGASLESAWAKASPADAAASLVWQGLPEALQLDFALAGGDDYELLFTAAPTHRAQVQQSAALAGVVARKIGRIEALPGLRLIAPDGETPLVDRFASFDHFDS